MDTNKEAEAIAEKPRFSLKTQQTQSGNQVAAGISSRRDSGETQPDQSSGHTGGDQRQQ